MKIEHVALLVAEPIAVARWYVQNLGMSILRSSGAPSYTHFLADGQRTSVLEIYGGGLTVPDYANMDPLLLHIAFAADDVVATRERLIRAGAVPVGELVYSPAGDQLAMLRDPWGLAIQLARRQEPFFTAP